MSLQDAFDEAHAEDLAMATAYTAATVAAWDWLKSLIEELAETDGSRGDIVKAARVHVKAYTGPAIILEVLQDDLAKLEQEKWWKEGGEFSANVLPMLVTAKLLMELDKIK